MNAKLDQSERLARISELVTQRDNLQTIERHLAGKANAYGFRMDGYKKTRSNINNAEWFTTLAFFSPEGVFIKSLSSVMEHMRSKKDCSNQMKKLLLSGEALSFWSSIAIAIANPSVITPIVALQIAAKIGLKINTWLTLSQEEKFKLTMEKFWQESQPFRQESTEVIAELDREIDSFS